MFSKKSTPLGAQRPGTSAALVIAPDTLYCLGRSTMATHNLVEAVQSLTPQEQEAVLQFIDYLKGQRSPFLQAADEFIAQHLDLLQRLAQ